LYEIAEIRREIAGSVDEHEREQIFLFAPRLRQTSSGLPFASVVGRNGGRSWIQERVTF
jgi:hypothetical protein